MAETPELSEDEFVERITELAKDGIREYCVESDGTVEPEHARMAAYEIVYESDLLEEYPLSIMAYKHKSAGFTPDSSDHLYSLDDMWNHILQEALSDTVEERIRELFNEWDAIQSETDEVVVREERTVFQE